MDHGHEVGTRDRGSRLSGRGFSVTGARGGPGQVSLGTPIAHRPPPYLYFFAFSASPSVSYSAARSFLAAVMKLIDGLACFTRI